jgi:hypothetical protein
VLERKAPPTFDVIIEIIEVDKLAVHLDVEKTVDRLLRGAPPRPEIRVRTDQGEIEIVQRSDTPPAIREVTERGQSERTDRERNDRTERSDRREQSSGGGRLVPSRAAATHNSDEDDDGQDGFIAGFTAKNGNGRNGKGSPTSARIFPYGVSRSRLDRAIMENALPAYVARDINDADVVLALKTTYKREPGKMREAAQRKLPVYVVRSNTYAQIANAVRDIFGLSAITPEEEETEMALLEAQEGADTVRRTNEAVELTPANSYTRRLQHQIIERYQLASESVGVEPMRRVRILPVGS